MGMLIYTSKGKGINFTVHWNYFADSFLLRSGIPRNNLLILIALEKKHICFAHFRKG